jgi:hypothetical protein
MFTAALSNGNCSVSETLLQRVLFLLDRIESPTISHAAAVGYSAETLANLASDGILGKKFKATLIPRPARFGSGDDLVVRETSCGLFGVVAEENDFTEPLLLEEHDRWLYAISLPHLVDGIRTQNGIDGSGFRNDHGLVSVGQRAIDGVGIIDVYLSLPNGSEDSVTARCRRLEVIASGCRVALLTPCPLDILIGDRGILSSSGIVPISLMAAAGKGHLKVNWDEAFGHPARNAGASASAGTTKAMESDLERLIEGKRSVGIVMAAKYLGLSRHHVGRLVTRNKKLNRVGQGRPMKISVESLREYKCAVPPGPDKKTQA